ncbi:MAG TPA: Coenzyme F420 hydrogenase/dehydrogenase, beta subunit C-terminal domain [Armatimonadota bacterium]|jgi:coenzyme F420-reducing hydrogenase beta subunit
MNVCSETVARDLCIGCGVCAGICTTGNLTMQWTPQGTLQPADLGKCLPKCRRCLDVCPFLDHAEDEDSLGADLFGAVPGIAHAAETGFHLRSFVGSAGAGYRERGASGGIASYVLTSLLERGDVDCVICVRPNHDPDRLFVYDAMADGASVRSAARSAYYPVELSSALQMIRSEEGRYAVIALPCTVKGLRLATRADTRLRNRIAVVAGLVCGQTKGRGFTDFLVSSLGMRPSDVDRVVFRAKDTAKPASNHLFTAVGAGGSRTTEWEGFYGRAWHSGEFSLNPCSFCDDVFAETADIVFMDAWLPEFVRDGRGTSIVLARTPRMVDVLEDGIARGALYLKPLPIGQVIASQSGAVTEKLAMLPYRLWLSRCAGDAPRKRVLAKRPPLLTGMRLRARERLRALSQDSAASLRAESSLTTYVKSVRSARWRLAVILSLERRHLRLRGALRAMLGPLRQRGIGG